MSNTTDPANLAADIQQILREYGTAMELAVDKAAKECGKEAAKTLRQTSPRGHRGAYAKGWAVKVLKSKEVVVYNKQYQLTHLLEHGHKTRYKNGQYGFKTETRAIEHIAPVADAVAEEFPEKINDYLKL